MTEIEVYTLADLAKFTDAKRRTVQLWAEAKAILADEDTERHGTGTHRRFSRTEAIIACLLHAFALKQMSIGTLIDIGAALRRFLANKADREQIEAAMSPNDVPVYLFMTCAKAGQWKATLATPPSSKADRVKQAARLIREATDVLDAHESMTFIIKVNTYLRRS